MKNIDLTNEFILKAPAEPGSAELNLSLGKDYSDSNPINYFINQDINKGPLAHITVYGNGLAIYSEQRANSIVIRTNGEFVSQNDGSLKLRSFKEQ